VSLAKGTDQKLKLDKFSIKISF